MALWGGRFEDGVDAFTQEFGASLEVDKNMAQQDIRGSIAHATMLAEQGVISDEDRAAIVEGLTQIAAQIEAMPRKCHGCEDLERGRGRGICAQTIQNHDNFPKSRPVV